MFGIGQPTGSYNFKKLGLALGRGSFHGCFLKEDWYKWLNGIKSEQVDEACEVPNPVAENRGGEAEVNEPEKKVEELPIERTEMIHRALGRIEGIACGCGESAKRAIMLSVLEISEAIGIAVDERLEI